MDSYLLLKEYICNNKIEDIVSLIQNSTLSDELVAWLFDFIEKTDCVNHRNTAAIALADMKCEQAVPILVRLVKKYCRTNSYATLLYALSLLDCREYINDIYSLIYDGNFEARHIVFDILSNNLHCLSDSARNQISEDIKRYLEDCNDKHELLVNTLGLFDNINTF